jgi:hypothetical protein
MEPAARATRFGPLKDFSYDDEAEVIDGVHAQRFGAVWTLDLEAQYKLSKQLTLIVGADNLLDRYPQRVRETNNATTAVPCPTTSSTRSASMAPTSTAACATPSKGIPMKKLQPPGSSRPPACTGYAAKPPGAAMTDFGTSDGAVSAMRGVAYGRRGCRGRPDPQHSRLRHLARRLPPVPDRQLLAARHGVAVIDPGVGTGRKSVVLKTKAGRYFVGPDNGLFTLIAERDGVAELREIDEKVNRLAGSGESYTFHGRDVYAYVGARPPPGPSATSRSARCCRPPW